MRILCVSVVFPPEWASGGTTATAYHSAKAFMSLGHEVLAITTGERSSAGHPPLNVLTTWDGVPVIYCSRRKGSLPYPFYSTLLPKVVREKAPDFQAASIRSSWTHVGPAAASKCKQVGLPYIAYAEGNFAPWAMRRGALKKQLCWHLYEKPLFTDAGAIVALTPFEADCIRQMGLRNRIEIIPNSVAVEQFDIQQQPGVVTERFPALADRQWITFMGRLHPVKGLPNLIAAFAAIAPKYPDSILVLAGPDGNGYKAELEKCIRQRHLDSRVVLLGSVSGTVKVQLLRNSTVFVLPSFTEGFSVAMLEALASRTPLIYSTGCHFPLLRQLGAGIAVCVNKSETGNGGIQGNKVGKDVPART